MENQKQFIELNDDSGDKKYFTQIPNCILDNSTAIDQALYLQLKRLTGNSKSVCYPSYRYLKKQLKIGETTLRKSFAYLAGKKWIDLLGKKKVKTEGGHQWVSTYKINDIWKENIEHYQGVPKQGHPVKKVSLKTSKVSLVVGANEEPIKEEQRMSATANPLSKQELERKKIHKDIVSLFDFYKALFVKRISSAEPVFNWAICEKNARPFMKQFGLEKMKKFCDYYLGATNKNDKEKFKNCSWSLSCFLSTHSIHIISIKIN